MDLWWPHASLVVSAAHIEGLLLSRRCPSEWIPLTVLGMHQCHLRPGYCHHLACKGPADPAPPSCLHIHVPSDQYHCTGSTHGSACRGV